MLLEAVNSVFITFLATEYLLDNDENQTGASNNPRHKNSILQHLKALSLSHRSRPLRYTFALVLSINAFVHFHAFEAALAHWVHEKVDTLFRIPRTVVAILTFLVALYWDCRQKYKYNCKHSELLSPAPWSNRYFLRQLLQSFCRLLPVYPFLAVIISFGFLFIITAFEKLHLPEEILNMPIYYGTLYGCVLSWPSSYCVLILLFGSSIASHPI